MTSREGKKPLTCPECGDNRIGPAFRDVKKDPDPEQMECLECGVWFFPDLLEEKESD